MAQPTNTADPKQQQEAEDARRMGRESETPRRDPNTKPTNEGQGGRSDGADSGSNVDNFNK